MEEPSEELLLSKKTWHRCIDPIEKDGFREGFEKGREKTFQEGFNIGFKVGFQHAFNEAVACGIKKANSVSYTKELDDIKGRCIICSHSEEFTDENSLENIIEKQNALFK